MVAFIDAHRAEYGVELLAPQTVSLSRAFSYNVNLQLAKENEADILRQNMARELASIVMHRLTKLK
jgi:outer membrane lipopolysaccharide assembly protein LptE/RlpB